MKAENLGATGHALNRSWLKRKPLQHIPARQPGACLKTMDARRSASARKPVSKWARAAMSLASLDSAMATGEGAGRVRYRRESTCCQRDDEDPLQHSENTLRAVGYQPRPGKSGRASPLGEG